MKMENMHISTKTTCITIRTVQVYTLTLLEVISHKLSQYTSPEFYRRYYKKTILFAFFLYTVYFTNKQLQQNNHKVCVLIQKQLSMSKVKVKGH